MGTLWIIILISILGAIIYKNYSGAREGKRSKICTSCGFNGRSTKKLAGSGVFELFLYLFFIIPGLFYSAYRSSSASLICPKCGNKTMIPLDSPAGRKLAKELGKE